MGVSLVSEISRTPPVIEGRASSLARAFGGAGMLDGVGLFTR